MDMVPVFSGLAAGSGHEVAGASGSGLSFDSPPRTLLVQIDVQDASGRVIDHDVRDLVVGGFTDGLAFGTPAVYRARTRRDLRALEDDAGAAPAVTRQFSRAEHLVIRVPVSGHQPATTTVMATLGSRVGGAMRALPVTFAGAGHSLAQVDVPLAGLASGAYVVDVSAYAGPASASTRIDFVVTP